MTAFDDDLDRRAGTDEPEWDYTKCRCENNGDYCDYCLPFHEPPEAEELLQRQNSEEI